MPHGLKAKQVKAAHMVAQNFSADFIARQLKMRRETLSRWKKIPEFKKIIHQLTYGALEEVGPQVAHLVDASIRTLWDAVSGRCDNPNRLKAALSVLKLAGIERITVPNVIETAQNEPEEGQRKPEKIRNIGITPL